jgi:hypothetical protein
MSTRPTVAAPKRDTPQPTPLPPASRRTVLKAAAVGSATIVVAGTGLLSYRVFDAGVLDPEGGEAFDPWRTWRDEPGPLGTVAAAVLAANPHNSQPWAFHVTGTTVEVYADRACGTGTLDPLRREMHIGLGCAIENLVLAASARASVPAVTLLPEGPGSELVARVELAEGAPAVSPLYDAIGDRHTNRGPYTSEPVTTDALSDLVDPSGLPEVAVHWVTSDQDRAELGRLMVEAATAITTDERQSRDSFAWFRTGPDAIGQHRDGLILDVQGLPPAMLTLAKLLPASSRTAGDRFWVGQTRDVHTKTAAAYGVITVTDPHDPTARLVGGRLLQRVHLRATRARLALHHMNQITERIDRERTAGQPATFAPRIAALLPTGVEPLAAFRIGHPVREPALSPRRPVTEVTR